MIDETSLDQLRSELRSTRRRLATLATGMVTLFVLGAAYFENEAVHGSFSIIDKGGKPVTILEQNGDVEIGGKLIAKKGIVLRENGDLEFGGKLVVKNMDVVAELEKLKTPAPGASELLVAAVPVSLVPIPAHPAEAFWGVTKGGIGPQSIINNATIPGEQGKGFLQAAALIDDTVNGEVVAAWITPTSQLHAAFNQDILIGTLETKVVSKNSVFAIIRPP